MTVTKRMEENGSPPPLFCPAYETENNLSLLHLLPIFVLSEPEILGKDEYVGEEHVFQLSSAVNILFPHATLDPKNQTSLIFWKILR